MAEPTARIVVRGADVALGCEPGETVLAALHRHGHAVRAGCRRGGCGICKLHIVDGSVGYTHAVAPSVLTDDERADGVCLTCRAVPEGEVTLEVRPEDVSRPNALAGLYAALGLPLPADAAR
jgi:ferredoxin